MSAGERVTWETCPRCGQSAAIGWADGVVVGVDCPGGCRLTGSDFAGRGPNGVRFEVSHLTTGADHSMPRAMPTPSLPSWSVPS